MLENTNLFRFAPSPICGQHHSTKHRPTGTLIRPSGFILSFGKLLSAPGCYATEARTIQYGFGLDTEVVNADDFKTFRGLHVSGELPDTFDSDDSYLKFNPGLTINSTEPPVWIEFDGTLSTDSPSSLSVTLEAQASTVGLTQTIDMFNWNTAQFELADTQSASWNNDSVVMVDVSDGISDYVQSGTGTVETRVGWKATGPVLNYP